jgi:metal-sulfur cluster biosynthetic enzyme
MSDDTPTVEKPAEGAQPAPAGKPSALPEAEITRLTDEIVTALKTVYDPEIPADIYEIGLIYRIDIADDRTVKVDMSLTSPNCPSAQELPVMVQMSVISVFDGGLRALFDGWISVDRFPDATERAAVLAAVKDAARR